MLCQSECYIGKIAICFSWVSGQCYFNANFLIEIKILYQVFDGRKDFIVINDAR